LSTQCCPASICFYLVYPMLPGQCLFLSCVANVVMPVSVCILCTQCCQARVSRYIQTRAWQHWIHKIKPDSGLATLGTQDKHRHGPVNIGYTWCHNVARLMFVCIMCTQCCQASVCLYRMYPMLPGQCLFASCVPNVDRPVSMFILCTQC
jgi:hypothetical protein